MQNLVFVEAYDEVETSLYLATTLRDVTIVVVGNDNLAQFFKSLGDKLPVQIIKIKSKQDKHLLKEVKNSDIYFLARYMNPLTLYLVQKLSHRNTIKYMHYAHYPDIVTPYHLQNIKEWFSLAHLKMLYGKDVMFGQMAWLKRFPLLSAGFFDKKVAVTFDENERNKMMKDFNWDWVGGIFDTSKYQIIYFDQPIEIPAYGYINDIGRYRKEIGDISLLLKECVPQGTGILRKYRSDSDVHSFLAGDDAPNYLPPMCLYNKSIKLYLGIYSSALYDTHGGTVVSLMDMITWADNDLKQNIKNMLISRSRNKILFPDSFEEFKSIVKGLYE